MAEFRKLDKSSSRKIAKEVCWEVMSAGRCRRGRWPGSNRPPRGESRGAGTAHAQRRASALQRADHRGLSERVPVAFTRSKLMASEGRSPLAGDFVGARSPGSAWKWQPGAGGIPIARKRAPTSKPVKPIGKPRKNRINPCEVTLAGGFVDKLLAGLNRTQTDAKRKPIGADNTARSRSPALGKNHHFISGNVPHHAALSGLKS